MQREGQIVTRFGTQKAAALLAWLALRPGPRPREQIIDAFWPDMDLPAGRNNLNTALSGLRRLLEPSGVRKGAVLISDHTYVGLDPAAVTTDVADFERLLGEAGDAPETAARAGLRERALALYGGDFQPGNYQDWAVREAERLSASRIEALDRLGDDLEALGRHAQAAAITQQRVAADPYAEDASVALVRRLMAAGQPGAAREAARRFETFWRDEFGGAPPPATCRAMDEILTRPVPAKTARAAPPGPRAATVRAAPAPSAPAPLPFWLSRFVGREQETARLASLLLSPKETPDGPDLPPRLCRLVTLTGPGGAGKTRLAAEFGRLAAERFGHWCGFVPLADVAAPEQVPAQLAQSLGLPSMPDAPPLQQVAAFFRDRDRLGAAPALLILDNLEHLLAGEALAGMLRTLLAQTTGLSLLCTSRRRIGLQGEQLAPVGPLPVPDLEAPTDEAGGLATMAAVPSVVLYLDRAQTVRPEFGLTPVNAPAVAALCRALEGSPLALELAASWVRLLPPRKMWERLSQGLSVPEGRHADLPPRHRSLSAALDWSWRLLSPAQRRLLARLSVFRGGGTLEAVCAVCEESCVQELLADLQEASLVTTRDDSDDVRYGLLETVRQYAAERLAQDDDADRVQRRHLDFLLALAEAAYPHLRGRQQAQWLRRLDVEHENLRAALAWGLAAQDGEGAMRMAGALWPFWRARGHNAEGLNWLRQALARDQGARPTAARGLALNGAGGLALYQSDYPAARALFEDSLAVWRQLGDASGQAASLNNLGVLTTDLGDYQTARTFFGENLEIRRRLGDEAGVACSLYNQGRMLAYQGDFLGARAVLEESLAIRRRLCDGTGVAAVLNSLGNLADKVNDLRGARLLHEESLAILRRLGDEAGTADALNNLAGVLTRLGEHGAARAALNEVLAIRRRAGNKLGVAWSLGGFAALALGLNQPGRAARLIGAGDALRQAIGCPIPPDERAKACGWIAAARNALGEAAFRYAWAAGNAMTWEQAMDYALEPGP